MGLYSFKSIDSVGKIFNFIMTDRNISVQNNKKEFLPIVNISKNVDKINVITKNLKDCDTKKLETNKRIRDCVFSSGLFQADGTTLGLVSEETSLYKNKSEGYKKMKLKNLYNLLFSNIVVFDTNSFINHVISNHCIKHSHKKMMKSEIYISPTTIWELENMCKAENSKNEEMFRKARLAKSAFRDIIFIQNICKTCILNSKKITISDFSSVKNILSEGEADRLIRNEISEMKEIGKYKKDFIFVTSDSFNCLAAGAEGIRSCFLPKPNILDSYLIHKNSMKKNELIGSFIREMAEDFGKIKIETKLGPIIVDGDWKGKQPRDWVNGEINLDIQNNKDKEYKALLKKMKINLVNYYNSFD
jgi:hypothetical protein